MTSEDINKILKHFKKREWVKIIVIISISITGIVFSSSVENLISNFFRDNSNEATSSITQIMENSPGSIQATGDVDITKTTVCPENPVPLIISTASSGISMNDISVSSTCPIPLLELGNNAKATVTNVTFGPSY